MGMGNGVPHIEYSCVKITFAELYTQHYFLIDENYKETGLFQEQPLDLNIDLYLDLDERGFLYMIKVLANETPIGYVSLIADRFLHYSGTHRIQVDSIFILPAYRSLTLFKTVLNYIEGVVKSYHVKHLFFASSVRRDLGKLLERNGFVAKEIVYCKEFKDG